jgi:hypothetical protein
MRKLFGLTVLGFSVVMSQGCSPDNKTTMPEVIPPRPAATAADGKTSTAVSSTTGVEAQ